MVVYCARSLIRNYRLGLRGDSQGIPLPPPQNKSAQQREQDFPLGFVFATLVIEYFPQIWQGWPVGWDASLWGGGHRNYGGYAKYPVGETAL